MNFFSFDEDQIISTEVIDNELKIERSPSHPNDFRAFAKQEEDFKDQFIIFQFSPEKNGPAILEASQVIPSIKGSEKEPDVLMALEMLSFNLGDDENIEKDTKATIRINIGKDQSSRDKYFDAAFWSIAAGLDLFNDNKKTLPKEFNTDFKKNAFGNRPIEIPGGLSKITFEVVKHKEPKWYNQIFNFLKSGTGKTLVSTIGFPAVTSQAISLIDGLINKLEDAKPQVLFKSRSLRLALSNQAKQDFAGNMERVKVGCLNPGFAILARARDYKTIVDANPNYYAEYGKLVPGSVNERELLTGSYDDPFKNVTYAIFNIGMKQTRLDPNFNYK